MKPYDQRRTIGIGRKKKQQTNQTIKEMTNQFEKQRNNAYPNERARPTENQSKFEISAENRIKIQLVTVQPPKSIQSKTILTFNDVVFFSPLS